jgi:hypothetical protein
MKPLKYFVTLITLHLTLPYTHVNETLITCSITFLPAGIRFRILYLDSDPLTQLRSVQFRSGSETLLGI